MTKTTLHKRLDRAAARRRPAGQKILRVIVNHCDAAGNVVSSEVYELPRPAKSITHAGGV